MAVFFITLTLLWNISNLPRAHISVPRPLRNVAHALRLDQRWAMFSPPLREDGWYVIIGTLESGRAVDVFRDGTDVSYEKPRPVAAMYATERWRKYLMNLYLGDFAAYRPHFAEYLCLAWNRSHSGAERVAVVEIVFMSEMTLPDYRQAVPERKSLWYYDCRAPFGDPALAPSADDAPSPSPSPSEGDRPSPTTGVPLLYPTL